MLCGYQVCEAVLVTRKRMLTTEQSDELRGRPTGSVTWDEAIGCW